MSWKIEKWLNEVFPGKSNIYEEYANLRPRELVIVSTAVLDVALAELLSMRLIKHNNEIGDFLGLDGNGRAPVGTFSSRIQLALLLGIITKSDFKILNIIKKLRNIFAHRVNTGFLTPEVLKETTKLHTMWSKQSKEILKSNTELKPLEELAKSLPKYSEAGEGLLISIFAVYQAYFHRLHKIMNRVNLVVTE